MAMAIEILIIIGMAIILIILLTVIIVVKLDIMLETVEVALEMVKPKIFEVGGIGVVLHNRTMATGSVAMGTTTSELRTGSH